LFPAACCRDRNIRLSLYRDIVASYKIVSRFYSETVNLPFSPSSLPASQLPSRARQFFSVYIRAGCEAISPFQHFA
jgi:hypothetical protein